LKKRKTNSRPCRSRRRSKRSSKRITVKTTIHLPPIASLTQEQTMIASSASLARLPAKMMTKRKKMSRRLIHRELMQAWLMTCLPTRLL